ncbi:hypothetical protein [Sporomusa carbonis]|uniref:hypothetical protein n=1 Tax=Sporomusa carbonis TaxID=3076075 RepID=UPI003C7D5E16
MLLIVGCANLTPVEPQPSPTSPSKQTTEKDVKVTYNYNATDKVQLSANNIVLKVGQRLILEPAQGLTKNTRFSSSGEYFFGDIMQQETNQQETGRVIFIAKKPGKGKLQIIPNTNETARAVDLWVTVE